MTTRRASTKTLTTPVRRKASSSLLSAVEQEAVAKLDGKFKQCYHRLPLTVAGLEFELDRRLAQTLLQSRYPALA